MKVVILGDPHFGGGYSLGGIDQHRQINTRLVDFSNTFDYVIDYMIGNSVSHFIITGDIFEHRRPQASELSLFSEKMYKISKLNIHTHIVVGNHDLTFAQKSTTVDVLKELKLPYIHIYSDVTTTVCDDGKEDQLNFIFFPFRSRKMLNCKTNEEAIKRLANHLDYEVKGITSGPKILIGHFMVEGTKLSSGMHESPISELILPHSMFENLDAAIMGHVHPHHVLRKNPLIAYVGSMERKKFDEGNDAKYFLSVDSNGGDPIFQFERLPVRSLIDITLDHSDAENSQEAVEGVKAKLKEMAQEKELFGSIVRMQVFLDEKALYGFNEDDIISFMKSKFNIHHCVGVSTHVSSKRQLRKDSITEHIDPSVAFQDFLGLEEDSPLKERMKELGAQIINERCK